MFPRASGGENGPDQGAAAHEIFEVFPRVSPAGKRGKGPRGLPPGSLGAESGCKTNACDGLPRDPAARAAAARRSRTVRNTVPEVS